MGKRLFFIVLTLAVALGGFSGCNKKGAPAGVALPEGSLERADKGESKKSFGYVLLDGLSLWNYDENKEADKQWEWLLAMTAGKKVELLDTKPLKIKKGKDELEWYRVRYDNKEGYTTVYYIGTYDTLAVVTAEKAMRFRSPEVTAVVPGSPLPKGTLMTVPREDLTSEYCRAYGVYKEESTVRYIKDIFVKRSDISTDEPDVQGYLLYYIAKNMSDPKAAGDPKRKENLINAKIEILNEAMKKYRTGVFADIIQEEIDALRGERGEFSSFKATQKVEVYESPELDSLVVGTIEKGVPLTIEEKTDVAGIEWVRISAPYVGWVLASMVSP